MIKKPNQNKTKQIIVEGEESEVAMGKRENREGALAYKMKQKSDRKEDTMGHSGMTKSIEAETGTKH